MRLMTAAVLTAVLAAGFGLVPAPGHAQPAKPATDRDKTVFNEFYRDKLRAVQRTPTTSDDRDLYLDMLQFASQIPDDPGVQGLIYSEVIPLAASAGDIDEMVKTAALMRGLWPTHPLAGNQTLIDLADRAYRSTRTGRKRVAEQYIDLLLDTAEAQAKAGDYKQAIALGKEANTVARTADSDKRKQVDEALDRYMAVGDVLSRIEMLSLSVRRNPQNRPAARELVELLVVKRNDPVAAAEFAKLTGDDDLGELVVLSAKGIENASAAEAMRVGDWYAALAKEEKDDFAEPLLVSAQAWYERFFDQYTRRDTLALRVRSMNDVVKGRLERIQIARGEVGQGEWIDLMAKHFDFDKHTRGKAESFRFNEGELTVDQSVFIIPFDHQGDFELRTSVTVNRMDAEGPAFLMYLPLGKDQAAVLRYLVTGEVVVRVMGVEAEFAQGLPDNRLGKQIEITVQAKSLGEDNYAINILINGQQATLWKGNARDLVTHPSVAPTEDDDTRALRLQCSSGLTFHKFEYRAVDTDD